MSAATLFLMHEQNPHRFDAYVQTGGESTPPPNIQPFKLEDPPEFPSQRVFIDGYGDIPAFQENFREELLTNPSSREKLVEAGGKVLGIQDPLIMLRNVKDEELERFLEVFITLLFATVLAAIAYRFVTRISFSPIRQ
jgi:hypothetical protein